MSLRSAIALAEAHIRDGLKMVERGKVVPVVAWDRLEKILEQRRKLTETEAKTIERVHRMVTADQPTRVQERGAGTVLK